MRSVLALCAVLAVGCGGESKPVKEDGVQRTETSARFQVTHAFVVPVAAPTKRFAAWLPVPQSKDPGQTITGWAVSVPEGLKADRVTDSDGNELLHVHGAVKAKGRVTITTRFTCQRWEVRSRLDVAATRKHEPRERLTLRRYLADDRASAEIAAAAKQAVGVQDNPIRVARALYREVLAHVDVDAKDPRPDAEKTMQPSGEGSATHAWLQCTGDSVDMHALFVSMARAVKLPARLVFGSVFARAGNGAKRDLGQRCWAEFHAPGIGWVPLDAALADLYTDDFEASEHAARRVSAMVPERYDGPDAALVEYYFGNLEPRRVVWHRGRDLTLTPKARAGKVRWNTRGHAEIDGRPVAVERTLTYSEVQAR